MKRPEYRKYSPPGGCHLPSTVRGRALPGRAAVLQHPLQQSRGSALPVRSAVLY